MNPSNARPGTGDRTPAQRTAHRDACGNRPELHAESLTDRLRRWRRALKSRLPYVRRRELTRAELAHSRFVDFINLQRIAHDQARIRVLKRGQTAVAGDVCLFVTHAVRPSLKRHVVLHVESLLAAGIQVVLIVNTDCHADELEFDASILGRLHAVYVRENIGFDFAAWAHAWRLCDGLPGCTRLFLVNDSLVGPLDSNDFASLIARVRACPADLVGLTDSRVLCLHLQSFFLVVQGRALRSELFARFFANIMCLPTKEQVILLYEIRLTQYFLDGGYSYEALFSGPAPGGYTSSDARFLWAELVADGMPYIKTSVLKENAGDPRIAALVPVDLLGDAGSDLTPTRVTASSK
jgi:hypothetical protein